MSQVILHHYPLSPYSEKIRHRPGSQGRKLELRRNSGMDAAPQAHTDDRRLSANSDPSGRGQSSTATRCTFFEPSKNWALRARSIRKVKKGLQRLLAGGSRKAPS